MKIGLIHDNLNICGGREFVAVSMINCFKELGYEIFLLSSRKISKSLTLHNFDVAVSVDRTIRFPVELPVFGTTYWIFLLPAMIRNKCDVIVDAYSSSLLPFVDITYFHGYRKVGKLLQKTRARARIQNAYYELYFFLQTTLSSHVSKRLILANSNFTAKKIQSVLNIRPEVIYPPVNLKPFKSSQLDKHKNLVVTISRFSSEKNLELIPLLAANVDAHFAIIGSVYSAATSAMYRKILALIKHHGVGSRVTVFANASMARKINLLRKAKVYFHTMPFEDFGISIVEGMAASCIPVVHKSGGPKEFVPSKWQYEDAESACQKIQEALAEWQPHIGEHMTKIAWQFSQERFREKFLETLKNYLVAWQ